MTDLPLDQDLRLFRELFDAMPQLGWTARADGFIDFYNRGWYEYTGTSYEEMQGWGWESVHDPKLLPGIREEWMKSIASGRPFELQFPLKRHDGEYRWFLTRANPLRNAAGQIYRWVGINTDITENRKLQDSLERERKGLLRIFTEAPAVIAGLRGPHHVFEFANRQYMQLVGEEREVIGLPIREALPEVEGQGFFELLDGVYETGKPVTGTESRVLLRKGDALEEHFMNFVYQPMRDVDGQVNGIFVHGTDVTAQVRARQQIETHAAELEQTGRMKDEFLATLSHELRTPMTAVLGWARLMKMGMDESEEKVAIDAIEQSASAQAELIDDVLDVSAITAGKLTFEPEPVDLAAVTRAALTAVHPAAVAKNIEVLASIPPALPPIAGNEGRLQQIVWNLLSNAAKFTPKGGSVTVRLAHIGSILRLTVEDTGQGIEGDFLPHVFEAFRQGDGSSTRLQGGLGLGLAIVRSLVELHGGRIHGTSDGPGKGSTFTVEFPVLESAELFAPVPGAPAKSTPAARPTEFPSLQGTVVLIIDDQNHTREVVAAIVRRAAGTAYLATSVREGLELLQLHSPQVVVCDVAMPQEDGYDFLRVVRAGPSAKTPIVALTAFSRPEDRERALAAGFDRYLKKPVEPFELVQILSELTTAD